MPGHDKSPARGPQPERVKTNQDWAEAMRKAMQKKKPEGGWTKNGAEEK